MNKKGKNSSSVNWKKIVGIVIAVLVVAALIVSLVSCQKKKSNSDKPKDKKVEEKDKKPKKKDKDKLTFVDQRDNYVAYRISENTTTPSVSSLSNNNSSSSTPEITPVVQKYDTEVTINGEDVTLEYKVNEYQEEGAKYINKKNSTIVSSGDVTDIKVYSDGQEVSALNIDSPVGEYQVVYTYTNPDGETITASRTVTIQDTTAPTITYSKAIEGNTAVYTFTVTDNSEIGSVDVDGTALTAENNQYTFTATENKTYTVTAKDIYENTSTDSFTVSELVTQDDLDNALTISNNRRRITKNNGEDTAVTDMRYASSNRDYSSSVDTNTFKDSETGNYNNPVSIGGSNRSVTTVTGNSTNQLNRNTYYYVYYEVTKTTTDGDTTYTATAADVQTVHFN